MRLDHSPLEADDLLRIIQILPDVIFRCERRDDGKIYWTFNEGRLAEEFHLTTREIEGKSLDELFPGGASSALHTHFEAAFRGESEEFINEIEGRFFRHYPQPVFDADGQVEAVVGFISEVTTQVRAQKEIQKLTEELARRLIDLSQANQDLEAFNYTLSHDLRTPLSVIDTQCHLLARLLDADDVDRDNIRNRLERIQGSSHRMADLIESILALARASRQELEHQDVDLSAMAVQIMEDLRTTDPERVVDVDIQDGIHAWGDAKLLHQVLSNLLGNAWKYTAKRPAARITFTERWDSGERIYVVRDDGAGFDMARAGRLFEPFKRLHDSEFEGTGIGLATVRKVIERHRGRIWAESTPGKGATFYFTLRPAKTAGPES